MWPGVDAALVRAPKLDVSTARPGSRREPACGKGKPLTCALFHRLVALSILCVVVPMYIRKLNIDDALL